MNDTSPPGGQDEPAGVLYAVIAYAIWGVVPVYWHQIELVSPLEMSAHRILWSAILLGGVALTGRRFSRFGAILRDGRLMRILLLTSVLICANWTIYVYSVTSHQLVQASLGYYITPLVSIVLGVAAFGERISRARIAAVALVTVAVAVKTLALSSFPWVSLALAFSFGFYGYFRKLTAVGAVEGLTVETWILLPLTLVFMAFWGFTGHSAFPAAGLRVDLFLVGGGVITTVPLILFAAGVRRIRLSTLGFLQYLGPSITLLIGVFLYGEPFHLADGVTFGCVWLALTLVAVESRFSRSAAPLPDLPPE